MNRAAPGSGHAHATVVDVGAIGQDGSGGTRCRDLGCIEIRVLRRAQVGPLHRDVSGQPTRHHPGRSRLRGDVAQVDEHLELLVARLVTGHDKGVIAEVGVEELLVAGRAIRVLGSQHGLVEPQVGDPEQMLRQVDDAIVHDQVVECAVFEGKTGHDAMRIDSEGLVARRVGVLREFLRRGDQRRKRCLGGHDGVGWQQSACHAPTVLLPTLLIGLADRAHQPDTRWGVCDGTLCRRRPCGGSATPAERSTRSSFGVITLRSILPGSPTRGSLPYRARPPTWTPGPPRHSHARRRPMMHRTRPAGPDTGNTGSARAAFKPARRRARPPASARASRRTASHRSR